MALFRERISKVPLKDLQLSKPCCRIRCENIKSKAVIRCGGKKMTAESRSPFQDLPGWVHKLKAI